MLDAALLTIQPKEPARRHPYVIYKKELSAVSYQSG